MPALNPETAMKKLIQDDAGLGATLGTRIYPGQAPQQPTFPLGIYERESTDIQHDMTGAGDLKHVRSVWTWYSENPDTLNTMCEDIEALLDANRSTVTIGADSIAFRTLFLEDQVSQTLQPVDGTGRAVYQITQTYFVAYQNT